MHITPQQTQELIPDSPMTPQKRPDFGGNTRMLPSHHASLDGDSSADNFSHDRRINERGGVPLEDRDSRNDSILQMFANQQENELLQQQVETLR